MPTEDEDGNTLDVAQVQTSVQGYATRVANMVDLGKFYKAHPDPHGGASTSAPAPGLSDKEKADEELADEEDVPEGSASPKTVSAPAV